MEGVNIKKKLNYESMEEESRPEPIFDCLVNLVDPKLKIPTKIKMGFLENGD